MITKFKITRLPTRAVLKISTVLIVLDQEYHISEQADMTVDISDRGVPYDNFDFKLGNDEGAWSPEYKATVNGQVDVNAPDIPYVETIVPTALATDITSSFVFNTSTDRIKIMDIDPKYGDIIINGNDIVIGQTYMIWEFVNVIFVSTASIISQNMTTTISIRAGNKNEFSVANDIDITTKGNLQGSIYGVATTTV